MREDEPLSFNFFLNFNICSLYSVYEDEMTRFFSVTGTVEQRQVFWFINRCAESGSYALDELFTEKEADDFKKLLQDRNQEYRIEEIPRPMSSKELPSWNLIGKVFELEGQDAGQLSFRVVSCAKA